MELIKAEFVATVGRLVFWVATGELGFGDVSSLDDIFGRFGRIRLCRSQDKMCPLLFGARR